MRRAALAAVLALAGACTEHPVQPVPVQGVAAVALDRDRLDLTVGASHSLTATVHDSTGNQLSGRVVSWVSSDTAVATVSSAGVVSAVGVGLASITATVEGRTAEADVNVTLPWPGVVSDPGAAVLIAVGLSEPGSASSVVYVSLVPGTVPGGERVTIRNRASGTAATAPMAGGGLDPVGVPANAGDTLDLEVHAPAGSQAYLHVVPARRRPRVVRSDPPARRRDVSLNSVIIVVFSEPVDSGTITAGTLRLTSLGQPIGSELVVLAGGLRAEVRPLAPLAPQTDYVVSLDTAITDMDAERLEAAHAFDFTTGAEPAPPLGSPVRIVFDSGAGGHPGWAGDAQLGLVDAPLRGSYRVRALDSAGTPVNGDVIDWTVVTGGGRITQAAWQGSPLWGTVWHTLGSAIGPRVVTARLRNVPGASAVTFNSFAVDAIVEVGSTDVGDCHVGFNNQTLTVAPGATVGWQWILCDADGEGHGLDHNVVFEDDANPPVSSPVKAWGYHVRAFPTAGVFRFRCTLHSSGFADGESGTVTVTQGAPPGAVSLRRVVYQGYVVLPGTGEPNLVVMAYDSAGHVAPAGVVVDWAVASGEGSVTPASDTTAPGPLWQGNQPYSRASVIVGQNEGTTLVTATAPGLSGSPSDTFSLHVVTADVRVVQQGFSPESVTVPAGKTIGWRWDSPVGHDVVFDDDTTQPVSSPIGTYGLVHTRKFLAPGSYPYHCAFHAGQETGVVTVLPPAAVVRLWLPDTVRAAVVPYSIGFLEAIVRNAGGTEILNSPVSWSLSDPDSVVRLGSSRLSNGRNQVYLEGHAPASGFARITASNATASATTVLIMDYPDLTEVSVGTANSTPSACYLATDGRVYCHAWDPYSGTPGTRGFQTPAAVATNVPFASISAGLFHACALATGGQAYCWGYNWYGQTGAPPGGVTEAPAAVAGGLAFRQVSAGSLESCGIATDGIAWCWGRPYDIPPGPYAPAGPTYHLPKPVPGSFAYSAISVGEGHACALTPAGEAYCWGDGRFGQLGDGARQHRAAPVRVAGGHTFAHISAGRSFTCAVTTSGEAWCWGEEGEGWGYTGTIPQSDVPRHVPLPAGVSLVSIDVGTGPTCGISTTGTAWCWGFRLHSSETATGEPPTLVPGGLVFTSVSSGLGQTCGVTQGVVYCWGTAQAGQWPGQPGRVEGQR